MTIVVAHAKHRISKAREKSHRNYQTSSAVIYAFQNKAYRSMAFVGFLSPIIRNRQRFQRRVISAGDRILSVHSQHVTEKWRAQQELNRQPLVP
jgi:hypothetical protein